MHLLVRLATSTLIALLTTLLSLRCHFLRLLTPHRRQLLAGIPFAVAGLILIGGHRTADAAIVYDAAADFSATTNPNGVWTYGSLDALGGLATYTVPYADGVVYAWHNPANSPAVAWNPTSEPVSYYTWTLQPFQLAFHPGQYGDLSTIRFTAPTSASYDVASSFVGIDHVGTTTGVHVLLNGASLFSGLIYGYGASQSYAATLSLSAGDVIDFAVDSQSNYQYDSTGVSATLTAVPEPSTSCMALAGLAFGGYLVRLRRKRA